MFKLFIVACFLALAAAAPKPDPQILLYSSYDAGYPAIGAAAYTVPSAYTAYTAASPYAAAYTAPSAYAAYNAYPYAGYGYGSPYFFRR